MRFDDVYPLLRDAAWPGWRDAFARYAPTFDPAPWTPLLGYVQSDGRGARVLAPHEVHAAGVGDVHAAALANLERQKGAWTPRGATRGGFLGFGKKVQALEHVAPLATERLLLKSFVERAQETLKRDVPNATHTYFYAPVRDVLWAVPGRVLTDIATRTYDEHPWHAVLSAEFDRLRAEGREVVCGAIEMLGSHVIVAGKEERVFDPRGGPPRPFVPLLDALVPMLTLGGKLTSSTAVEGPIPARPLTRGSFGVGLAVAVKGAWTSRAVAAEGLAPHGLTLEQAETIAWRNVGPAGAVRTFAPGAVGYREPHAAARIADPEAMLRLHAALQAPRICVAIVTEWLLVARAAPVDNRSFLLEVLDYTEDPRPPGQPRGYVGTGGSALSPIAHVVEDGRLVHTPEPRSFDAGLVGAALPAPKPADQNEYETWLMGVIFRGEPVHWRTIGRQLPERFGARAPELMSDLGRLEAADVVVRVGEGTFGLTPRARALCEKLEGLGVIPKPRESLAAALRGNPLAALPVITPLLKEPGRLGEMILEALGEDPSIMMNALSVIAMLPPDAAREALFRRALDGASPAARLEALASLSPGLKTEKPGKVTPSLPADQVAGLLASGLADASTPRARGLAAKGAFATGRVAGLERQLTAALASEGGRSGPAVAAGEAPAPGDPREAAYWAALALGCASDADSLGALLHAKDHADDLVASAAAAALALRLDGRSAWREALEDPRPAARAGAHHALRRVVTGLSEQEIAWLEAHPSADVREGVRKYLLRRGKR